MLRNTRDLAADMVFTIEPGCYFIPLLLEPQRSGENRDRFNWDLIEQLYTLGGVRVEDNVRVTQNGVENLTPGEI
jgi:Xaa-Pro dipeptidase